MEERQYSFGKEEHLCSEKLMDDLFRTGQRLMAFPYSVRWKVCPKEVLPEGVRAQVLIATSKRYFHHAVDRNRVKRLTRECYRQHKPELWQVLEEHDVALLLAVNYVHNEIFEYKTLYHKFDKLTKILTTQLGRQLGETSIAEQNCGHSADKHDDGRKDTEYDGRPLTTEPKKEQK